MANLNRIYFDTNPLLEAGWPRLSSKLETLLTLAKHMNVAVFIPEPVEQELESHLQRNTRESIDKAVKNLKDAKRLTSQDLAIKWSISWPTDEEMIASYRKEVAQIKQEWEIKFVPFTSCELGGIFRMAINRMPPFKEKGEGAGFQDAVICRSVMDHVRTDNEVIAALVTSDNHFNSVVFDGLGNNRIQVIRIDNALELLEQEVERKIHEHWEAERQTVGELLITHKDMIGELLREKLSPTDVMQGLGLAWIPIGIQKAEVLSVGGIQTAPPPFALDKPSLTPRKADSLVKIGARARVGFTVQVRDNSLALGLFGLGSTNLNTSSIEDSVLVKSETMEQTVDIEAAAKIEGNQLRDFRIVSARVNRHPFGTGVLSLAAR